MKDLLQKPNLRFLLSRTDNIGDVILTLPLAHLLKRRFPDCRIYFLARDYVKAIVEACPAVDGFLSWDVLDKQSDANAADNIALCDIDIVLHVFPNHKIAKLMFRAEIGCRIGTSHRWYHYLYCNQQVKLNRKDSQLHEAQLNLALLTPLEITEKYSLQQLKQLLKLSPTPIPLPNHVEKLLDPHRFNLIIHPLSNKNGREWPLSYYLALITSLPKDRFNIFITGASHEVKLLRPLTGKCSQAHDVSGQLSLNELIEFMRRCDGLLAGSTGPLHMASALGIKTLGLYPPAQTMNPARWAPMSQQAEYLVAESDCVKRCLKPEERTCACMNLLSVEQVKKVLLLWKK